MSTCLLEVSVEDAAGFDAAIAGGADRVELCSAASLGGLTPLPGLMALAARAPIPAHVLVRPRRGDFVFTPTEMEMMRADIALARCHGLRGVVLGANQADGRLDVEAMKELVDCAHGFDLTLHRAFDLVPDFIAAVDLAVDLGFSRILTSGGAASAMAGLDTLEAFVAHAGGRISIMPGAGVNGENAADIVARLGVGEIHASASVMQPAATGKVIELGFDTPTRRTTSRDMVAAIKAAIRGPGASS